MTRVPETAPLALAGASASHPLLARQTKGYRATKPSMSPMYFLFPARRIWFRFSITLGSVLSCHAPFTESRIRFAPIAHALKAYSRESNVGHATTMGSVTGVRLHGTM